MTVTALQHRDLHDKFRRDMTAIRQAAMANPDLRPLLLSLVTAAENVPDHTDAEAWRWSPPIREAVKLAHLLLSGQGGGAA